MQERNNETRMSRLNTVLQAFIHGQKIRIIITSQKGKTGRPPTMDRNGLADAVVIGDGGGD